MCLGGQFLGVFLFKAGHRSFCIGEKGVFDYAWSGRWLGFAGGFAPSLLEVCLPSGAFLRNAQGLLGSLGWYRAEGVTVVVFLLAKQEVHGKITCSFVCVFM